MIPDFKVDSLHQKSGILNGEKHHTRAYEVWQGIKRRCKVRGEYQTKRPTYAGCYLSDNFKDFQYFANWCHQQIGYGFEGYHLGKDILVEIISATEKIIVYLSHKV